MSLFRQLLLLISALFLLIFGGNLAIGVHQARAYLQSEGMAHAQDTATSLGLSLSPHLADPADPIIATMIRAIYDRGYYQEIRLRDLDGQTLVVVNDSQVFAEVPAWFRRWVTMETATATTKISRGWQHAGTLEVSVHPGYAYLKLYRQVQYAFWYSLAALTLSVLVLALLLRFTLQPLRAITRLALTIADGHFTRIDPLPWTREVRLVASAMNRMSAQLAGVVAHLNGKLKDLGERLQRDPVTGLYGPGRLETDLDQWLASGGHGWVMVLRIADLGGLAARLGAAATDRWLRDGAHRLSETAQGWHPEALAYRRQGAEFVLLLPGQDSAVEPFAANLSQRLAVLGKAVGQEDIVHLGLAPFTPLGTVAGMLASAADACAQARLIGPNAWFISQDREQGLGENEWRGLLKGLESADDLQVTYVGAVHDLRAGGLLLKEAFIQYAADQGRPIPAGILVGMAEKYGQALSLDRGITRRVLDHLRMEPASHAIAVNLSLQSLANADFRDGLGTLLRQHAPQAARLVFGFSAYSAAKDPALVREFGDAIRRLGARILIKRYEPRFMGIEELRLLHPHIIRLARDLTRDIAREGSKRALVEAMAELGALMGIPVIAEGVEDEADRALLGEIGLAGASG